MRHPHPCRESFATDVTKREDQTAVGFFNCEEITRQMTNGEDLARNVERTVMNQTRCTQAPVYFRCLEDRGVQIRVIFLKCFKFLFECVDLAWQTQRGRNCGAV